MSLFIIFFLQLSAQASSQTSLARPVYSHAEILAAVATKMNITLSADIPAPTIAYSSTTELKEFQDAVAAQWGGYRPEAITNVYLTSTNTIYIVDDLKIYAPKGRYIDDSIAHELVHFLQVKYKGIHMEDSDAVEMEAVTIQNWFRETYFPTPQAQDPSRI